MGKVLTRTLWLAMLLCVARPAAAQDGGVPDGGTPPWMAACPPDAVDCNTSDVDFQYRDALFDAVMLDSGWVPSGAALQVRFAVYLGGSTEIDMGGAAVTSWPPALDVAVPGRPATGLFRIDYGIEIVARIRIDVTVAGVRYNWEGDIPIPGHIPRDLRLFDEVTFDPFALPMADPRPIMVWDDTDPLTILNVGLTDSLIPIPGIRGGFLVDAVGSLTGTYATDRIEISDAVGDITAEGQSVVVRADPGADDLGEAKDYTVLPHGTIGYDGVITLRPQLYVEIAGHRFDLTLAEVPLNVVDLSSQTDFDPASVHVPLPSIRVVPTSLSFGESTLGSTEERLVSIYNDGEAPLRVTAADPAAPFTVVGPTLTIPPRSAQHLSVRFSPGMPGAATGVLLLSTNDPDDPLVSIRMDGTGIGQPDAGYVQLDAGVPDGGMTGYDMAGGCGCRTAGRGAPGPGVPSLLGLAFALVLVRRRR